MKRACSLLSRSLPVRTLITVVKRLSAAVALLCAFAIPPASAARNVLLLIADDFGTDTCARYNPDVSGLPRTPTIDSLATNGVVFRNAYAPPVCSPTRACIMTGRYAFRHGVGDAIGPLSGTGPLPSSELTLPEAIAAADPGYRLAHFGKWHLANAAPSPGNIGGWPHYAGCLIGQVQNYTNWLKTVNGVQTTCTRYATTDLVDDALDWIQSQGTNRWFAWCAFNAPHAPVHKPPAALCPDYAHLSGTTNDIATNGVAYFHAMVQALDTEMARLIAAVNRDETRIIFIGDNGTVPEFIQSAAPPNRAKRTLYKGGVHVPLIITGPEVARRGSTNDTIVHAVDLFATILEMTGIEPARAIATNKVVDARSLVPLLQATNAAGGSRYGFVELFGDTLSSNVSGRALRNDRYKLIRFSSGVDQLYDMANDPFEFTNLLATALSPLARSNYNGLAFALGRYQETFTNVVIAMDAGGAVTVRRHTNLVYELWRAQYPDDNAWEPVPGAVISTNGIDSVSLIDTNALPGSPWFWSVMGRPRRN